LLSFPIALGIYWVLLIQLFSMDPGDSWMVVMILAVFDQIVRTALILLLLKFVLSWGGASTAAIALPAIGAGANMSSASPLTQQVQQLKELKRLEEARAFIAGGRQGALSKPTEAWYAAGATNVWFEVSRDINGRMDPECVIVEMPAGKDKRAKCYDILKAYFKDIEYEAEDDDFKDDGEPYLFVPLR
ncbi:MAG: hypothetical protein ACREJC_16560, partial [Tepidisphaeraceae bacterium]